VDPKRPLIFVPGIRTSRLAIKKEDGSLEHFWPLMPHEFLIKNKLDDVFRYLETEIRLSADDDGIPVIATSLIPMAYDGLIREILAWGYKPNVDFWIFPYDWRQSNSVSGQLLAEFIEEKIRGKWENGVDIVSHSMGGIITRAACKFGAPIRRAAYIACPHFGSPLAYFVLHPQINSQQFMSSIYPSSYIPTVHWRSHEAAADAESRKTLYQRRKELFVRFPSIYELLPDESYLNNRPMLFADNKPIFGADDTYLRNDWAFKAREMQAGIRKAMEFKKELGEELPGNKDHDILLICGTGKLTCDSIRYQANFHISVAKRKTNYVMQRGFSLPYDSGQRGDGYVPITSAMASTSGSQEYRNSVFISEAHVFLPNEETAAEAIGRFLAA
jgi:pimeloyl-ACP methyl ester carboxylesterase